MAQSTTRAVGYIRSATPTHTHKENSTRLQAQRIREYCRVNHIALVGVFADHEVSGDATVRKGRAEALIVTNVSRLTLFVAGLAPMEDSFFSDGTRTFIAIDEQLDTRT